MRDRRRSRGAGPRRHPGRRGHRLHGSDASNVLIECAYFDPLRTAATGRKAGVQSDARYRFERGVDPAFILPGPRPRDRHDAGGRRRQAIQGEGCRRTAGRQDGHRVSSPAHVEKLAASSLEETQIRATLERARLRGRRQGRKVKVTRRAGGRTFTAPPIWSRRSCASPASTRCRRRRCRALRGVARAVLTRAAEARAPRPACACRPRAGGGHHLVVHLARHGARLRRRRRMRWSSPIRSRREMSSMRPSLLPGLLSAVQSNRNRGFADVALFEVGQAYRGDAPEDQFIAATGVRAGAAPLAGAGRHWSGTAEAADLFDAKADVVGAAGGARLRRRQGAADARCAGLVPSRPLGDAAARSQDRAGPFRRNASRDAARARCRRARCGLRSVPRCAAAAEEEGRRRGRRWKPPTCCRCAAISPSCSTATCRPATSSRRRWRRQEADRGRQRIRPVRGREPGRGQEVACARGDAAAAGEDTDGPGDRSGRRQDRRRGQQGDGRRDPRGNEPQRDRRRWRR